MNSGQVLPLVYQINDWLYIFLPILALNSAIMFTERLSTVGIGVRGVTLCTDPGKFKKQQKVFAL